MLKKRFMLFTAVSTLLFFAVCTLAWGGFLPENKELLAAKERVGDLRADISLINLLNGLHLTREQSTRLLALAKSARESCNNRINSPEVMATLKATEQALVELRAEIQKGDPARGDLPSRANEINHRLKDLSRDKLMEISGTLKSLEAEVKNILTPEQLQVVENFQPCLIPPRDLRDPVNVGQAGSGDGVVRILRRVRALPEERWNAIKDDSVRRHIERTNWHMYRMTTEEKEAEAVRILALTERVRKMSEIEFEMQKEELAAQVKPENKLKALRDEIQARDTHPKRINIGRLGRWFLHPRIIPILEERLARDDGGLK